MDEQTTNEQTTEETTQVTQESNPVQTMEERMTALEKGLSELLDVLQNLKNNGPDSEQSGTEDDELRIIEDFVSSIENGNPVHPEMFQRILDDIEARIENDGLALVNLQNIEDNETTITDTQAGSSILMVGKTPFEGSSWIRNLGMYGRLDEIDEVS